MDPLSDFLDGHGARPVVAAPALSAPWEIAVGPSAALVVVAVVAGSAVLYEADEPPTSLAEGEVLVLRSPHRPTLRHAAGPATLGEPAALPDPRRARVPAGEICVSGADLDGPDVVLVAAYPASGLTSASVTSALPEVIRVDADLPSAPVLAAVATEAREPRIGRDAAMGRLADLVLVDALRAWFAGADAAEQSWLRASWDPFVGAALRLIHDEAGAAWTLQDLADAVGCSRTTLTRRFHALVGEPPMTYLAQWRLSLAADLLSRPGATVPSVARSVGYADPFAFGSAFRRRYSLSPQRYRRDHARASAQGG